MKMLLFGKFRFYFEVNVLFTDGLFVQCMQKFKDKETIKKIYLSVTFLFTVENFS
jgi:hypothetical protein